MPYQYTCHACQVHTDMSPGPGPAQDARTEHRESVHDGMQPSAGDRVHHVMPSAKGPAIFIGVLLAFALLKDLTGILPEDIARWIGLI